MSSIKRKSKLLIKIGIVFLILIAGIMLALYFIFLRNAKESAINEMNFLIGESFYNANDSINFSTFNTEKPLQTFQSEKFWENIKNLAADSKYLKSSELINQSDTKEYKLVGNFNVSNRRESAKFIWDLNVTRNDADIIDSLNDFKSTADLVDYLQSSNNFVQGYFEILNYNETSLKIDLELIIVDGESFLKINNIDNNNLILPEDVDTLTKYTKKMVRVDLAKLLQYLFNQYDVDSDAFTGSVNSDVNSFILDLNNTVKNLSPVEIQYVKTLGPEITNVIANGMREVEYFENSKKVDPIVKIDNISCYEGNLSANNILFNLKNSILQFLNSGSLNSIEGINPLTKTFIKLKIEEQFNFASIAAEQFSMKLKLCNNSKTNENIGIGVSTSFFRGDDRWDVNFDLQYVRTAQPQDSENRVIERPVFSIEDSVELNWFLDAYTD